MTRFKHAFAISWRRIQQHTFSNIITILVIATTLSLPAVFWALANNLSHVSNAWRQNSEITAYLISDATTANIDKLVTDLKKDTTIADVRYISPEEGLKELSLQSNLRDLSTALPNNPLPGVISITLKSTLNIEQQAQKLSEALQHNKLISSVQVDATWMHRLHAISATCQRVSLLLGCLLGIGVILIISNSIQVTLERHRHEMSIYAQLGATNWTIRAPFLLAGSFLGCVAGLMTWLIVILLVSILNPSLSQLAHLYDSDWSLARFSILQGLMLLTTSTVLGTLGALFATRKVA
ncbi:MAG: ABC transporter permease [Pseudomonadota bacterium]|nr:ABC transporter permease [Pseudomonadota bacterium]